MSSYYRQQLEDWLKTIDVKAGRVLDVGGSQLPIKGRTKSWDVKEYKILDLLQPHECKREPDYCADVQDEITMCKELMVTEKILESGINKVKIEISKPKFPADIIFCLEVSEYWWDPREALENIKMTLKKKGIFYISFPFIYPVHNPMEEDCLRYTEYGARKLLEEAGFEIEYVKFRYMHGNSEKSYKKFIALESMRPSKVYDAHYATGLLVKAIKV